MFATQPQSSDSNWLGILKAMPYLVTVWITQHLCPVGLSNDWHIGRRGPGQADCSDSRIALCVIAEPIVRLLISIYHKMAKFRFNKALKCLIYGLNSLHCTDQWSEISYSVNTFRTSNSSIRSKIHSLYSVQHDFAKQHFRSLLCTNEVLVKAHVLNSKIHRARPKRHFWQIFH